jgi:N,N'-diacetyllegionaminate synthase
MSKVMIIAEAGVNHNGDLNIAKQLVDAASVIGADAIKFQTFRAKHLAVPDARKADYQIENTGQTMSQYEMLKSLELSWQEFEELFQYCSFRRIQFLSSPFDEESILFLDRLGVDLIKIPSGEITNYGYLKKIASLKKRVILSTGMSNEEEVGEALEILEEGGQEIILLHCSSSYPALMQDVNLNAMDMLKT